MAIRIHIYGGHPLRPNRYSVIPSSQSERLRKQRELDRRNFERVNSAGGIWGCSPLSDRIGP